MTRSLHVLAAFAAVALASGRAGAQDGAIGPDKPVDKAECIGHLDRAQSLQSARKFKDARASYLACTNPSCPELLREDCSRSLVDLDANTPTVVFSARADGHDIADVRVLLDGEALSSALDGRAVALDPGAHVARFEAIGPRGGNVEIRVVAREGEKNRPVTATFAGTQEREAKPKTESGRVPVLPIILGGTGLLALGGSFYVRLNADSDADEMRRTCAPACDPGMRDALSDKLVVANVALGVGLGAIALAAATWLFDPRH
ncbi:MAG: hypothetical protein KF819_19290 [Labilithrix sp.]|nr:hypothetical protein [Labilithrix sp.]